MLERRIPPPELISTSYRWSTRCKSTRSTAARGSAVSPLLKKGDRKLIINVSSEAGSIADCWRESEFAYSMSKAALNMQSKILQNYLKPRGFKVLAVHPGWMQTDMGGADADIPADEAAEGIFRLAEKNWNPDDEIYMDYRGQPLPW
jgi:NAD(P)-dependent dehydrogenase (short-subunit alcohol dehydrogenase family)